MSDNEPLKVGDKAPTFTLKSQDGKDVSLNDFIGKKPVVLIFYPGDMTPGCTIQLCSVRDDWSKYAKAEVAVLGINHADAESHQKFLNKYHFPFPLLVDTDKKVSKKYGAIKKLFSATVIKRTVVAVDKNGVIKFYRQGMPKDTEILKALTK
ncbi:MAG: peroxiredoxin [Patescibacteria group bacterium]|jgi:peroxiredoxin Q/BCP